MNHQHERLYPQTVSLLGSTLVGYPLSVLLLVVTFTGCAQAYVDVTLLCVIVKFQHRLVPNRPSKAKKFPGLNIGVTARKISMSRTPPVLPHLYAMNLNNEMVSWPRLSDRSTLEDLWDDDNSCLLLCCNQEPHNLVVVIKFDSK